MNIISNCNRELLRNTFPTISAVVEVRACKRSHSLHNITSICAQVKLSVAKSDKPLPPELRTVKRKLGLTLITFEDALIDLEPFVRMHPFETVSFLTNAVVHHYQVSKSKKFSYLVMN